MNVGWIGVGHMGKPMAMNVLAAGFDMKVHDLDRNAATDLLEGGAEWADSPREAATGSDVVFTCLPMPHHVYSVGMGDDGIKDGAGAGTIVVDSSTNSLDMVRRLHAEYAEQGIQFLDVPVSGGVIGAETRDLCVMAGGDEAGYERIKPVLDAMGDKVMYCGPIGNGTICKLSHQLFGSVMRQGMQEVLLAGAAAGVPVETLVKAISQSNAAKNPPFHNWERPPKDFTPDRRTFYLELAAKDVRLANQIGRDHGVPMDLANIVEQRMIEALNRGWGKLKAEAIVMLLQERSNTDLSTAP